VTINTKKQFIDHQTDVILQVSYHPISIEEARNSAEKTFAEYKKLGIEWRSSSSYSFEALCYCLNLNFKFFAKLVEDEKVPSFLGREKKKLFDRRSVLKSMKNHGYFFKPRRLAL